LRVFHGENGALVDRTVPPNPLTPPNPIKVANVSSLSPFVIALQPPQAALQFTLADLRALRQTVTGEDDAHRLDERITALTGARAGRLGVARPAAFTAAWRREHLRGNEKRGECSG